MKKHWRRVPNPVRKPFVLILGALFIITAVLTGWLPGPGGIPLFLIGIAILATEFAWAGRVRDYTLSLVKRSGKWIKSHPVYSVILAILIILVWIILYQIISQYLR